MKFLVTRTSTYEDKKPCEEAFKEKYTYVEVRTLTSPEKFDEKFGKSEGLWMSRGENHCINKDGYIQREFPNDRIGWFIEINSIEDLIEFNDKYGEVILTKNSCNKSIREIEIYDDYRE